LESAFFGVNWGEKINFVTGYPEQLEDWKIITWREIKVYSHLLRSFISAISI